MTLYCLPHRRILAKAYALVFDIFQRKVFANVREHINRLLAWTYYSPIILNTSNINIHGRMIESDLFAGIVCLLTRYQDKFY